MFHPWADRCDPKPSFELLRVDLNYNPTRGKRSDVFHFDQLNQTILFKQSCIEFFGIIHSTTSNIHAILVAVRKSLC